MRISHAGFIRTWKGNKVLRVETRTDEVQRKKRCFVVPGDWNDDDSPTIDDDYDRLA
jgi:hypothetical protein